MICFSALERQEEKLSAEKAELVKLRVALYEQYADGNMSKEEFIRQRDAYRVQEDEKMELIQRLRTEKNQAFLPVKRDTDHLQTVISTVEEAGDVMHLQDIYSDEGKSGTSLRKRDAFKRMMQDAKDQKMDLIICASISRFARNFSDCMTQIAALKTMHPAHPIGVYFETENIYTLNPNSQYNLD